ncbi:hypothetical protein ACPA54_03405 [Uniformispora flossi]|uniref:hypothetical protein n=1 Tax=Uniformispora flossi TaxID=3390723 RepID=UPI003C2CAC65
MNSRLRMPLTTVGILADGFAAGALARLRADGIGLIYDQNGRTRTAATDKNERIAIGR